MTREQYDQIDGELYEAQDDTDDQQRIARYTIESLAEDTDVDGLRTWIASFYKEEL